MTPPSSIAHYRITAKLGAGGMGEVYRATDTKLGRDVALKVLPAEMAADPDRLSRFQREARALAALNHPHIVTIFSVEETGGVHFLTMELVEGHSLDRRIPAGGLPLDQIVQIAAALAEALAAAHEKGIVHRDLKPANVMVTEDGRVKVLDFGLAKDVIPPASDGATLTSAGHTQAGIVMGTPAYMSPEQVSARPLDHRTDIFSLGVVLHEMATGRRPFDGHSSAELASAILRDSPPLVTDVRADLPADLARVIRRCLEKDPRHRVQTARDVSNEFRDLARQASQKLAPATPPASRAVPTVDSGASRAEEGFWFAVLPFKSAGTSAELKALADGLSEEVVAGLSRFSYLRVITRGSTQRYADQAPDVRVVGKELGARYVMNGSLRQVGARLRVAVQLVDAATGAQLWAETYERPFSPESVFELQDDLVPRIVSTVADMHGVLPRSMSEAVRLKTADQMSPYEALLRSFDYNERFTPEEHAKVRTCLEHAVQQAPGYADCWAMLSVMYSNEYGHWDNARPDSLERALRAARTAVEAAPLSSLPYYALALALFFRREIPAFRVAAERAVSLNPMDGATVAFMGLLIAYAGDWERGCALSEKGSQLNPNHPGWYGYTAWHNAYRKKDYRGALDVALKLNAPNNFYTYSVLAITHAQLGEMEEAHKALRHLLALKPDFAKVARKVHGMWIEPDLVEHLMDGLRKAGLEIAPEKEEAAPAPGISRSPAKDASGADSDRGRGLRSDSGSARAQAFWIAVVPFTHSGADSELESFAEGLAEDVTAGLARFPYLSVISRNSTLRFKGQTSDVRAVGEQLGARYVLEGGIRKGASTIRINIQLIDTQTGAHLWAETYNRDLKKSDIFSVQDDLTDRVVATVADAGGVLVRSMAADVEEKPEAELTASDWMLRQFSYRRRLTPEAHAKLREGTERFAEREPKHAEVWACLAQMCIDEFCFGFNRRPDALDRALAAARHSVDLDRTFPYGNQILAQVQFFRRDIPAFRTAAEQAMALNSRDTDTLAMMGLMLAHIGEFERGAKIVRRAMDLNPHHAGWFHFALIWEYFQKGDYEKALEQATRVNMPGLFWQPLAVACICGLLGRQAEAAAAVQELRKLDKDIELHARENIDCWHYSSGLMDRILEGLSKAGLDVPAAGAERTPDRGSGTRKGKKSVTRPPGA